MLALGRHVGQALLIGQDVRITVISVSGKQVRLAIEAPAEVPILREELVRTDDAVAQFSNACDQLKNG